MTNPTDKNPAEQIRAEYVETIARVLFAADAAEACSDDPFEDWAARYQRKAAPYVDALAEAGLLPIETMHRVDLPRQRTYCTPWREVSE